MNENKIGNAVINYAIQIHQELEPGLFESVYELVLAHELKEKGLKVNRQVVMPILYKGLEFNEGFRADIIVEDKVIIELKSIEQVNRVHKKQVLTYLKLSNMKLGYLLNFGQSLMKDGITRLVNGEIE